MVRGGPRPHHRCAAVSRWHQSAGDRAGPRRGRTGMRIMDGIDPVIRDESEAVLAEVPGVEGVGEVRLRWIGHRLHAEAEVTVDESRTIAEAHDIAEQARHALLHEVPHLASAIIHADPCGHGGSDPHAELAHHYLSPRQQPTGPAPTSTGLQP